MPTIIVNKKRGLFQKASTTANPAGTIAGDLKVIKSVVAGDALTEADSGKIFVCGGTAGTIEFPVTSTGWYGTFIITGSVAGDLIISGTATTEHTSVTMVGSVVSGSTNHGGAFVAGATNPGVIFTSPGKFTFDASAGETAGDRVDITVVAKNSLITGIGYTGV